MEPSLPCIDRSCPPTRQPLNVYRMRYTRPSLLDPQLESEPSIAPCQCMPLVTVLYVEHRPVAIIPATTIDQAALASCLAALRMRTPRTALS